MAFGAGERRPWAVVLVCRKRACGSADLFHRREGRGREDLVADASAAPPRRGTFDVVQQFSNIGTLSSNCDKVRG
jgi:hypothetical protein